MLKLLFKLIIDDIFDCSCMPPKPLDDCLFFNDK